MSSPASSQSEDGTKLPVTRKFFIQKKTLVKEQLGEELSTDFPVDSSIRSSRENAAASRNLR